jgi:glycolate oxidase FAD binding subunit
MNAWVQTQLPISATYFNDNVLYVRIEGLEKTSTKVHQEIGGSILQNSQTFWKDIKNHQAEFFKTDLPLWRVIIPNNTPALDTTGDSCLEWNGGLRWIKSSEDAQHIIKQSQAANGYATLFKASAKPLDCLASINPRLQKLHLNLKSAFDPNHILNPGRMYSWC